ncbi:MAG: exonuclease subunit SbcD [Firmicutes bacterium]|nr:exonuclease subunit SbcD [Bacillota bacterium]
MLILHTSDWHLGKYLNNRDRLPEQREVIDEICRIVEERQVHLVLITGDIFDTFVPSAAAEELFYDAINRLSAKGNRAVIIIAGNHDSPERLCAAKPLADRNGIILLGLPASQAGLTQAHTGVKVIQSGQGWLELAISGVPEHAVIITLPYPSESRLDEAVSNSMDEALMQKAYSEKVGAIFAALSSHFREDTVNLAASHLFIMGGESSDSERLIQLGGALTVDPARLPVQAQYLALGHLHKPQKAPGAKIPAYYSGSPLPYSFSETGYRKSVYLIEAYPGQAVKIEQVELQSGKPLVKWVAKNGFPEVMAWLNSEKDKGAWIDLEIYVEGPLTPEEIRAIRSAREDILDIRPVILTSVGADVMEDRQSQPLSDLFVNFYRSKTGTPPRPELLDYFLRIAGAEQEETNPKGGAMIETA